MQFQPMSEAECRRIQRLPECIANTERKLAALRREAERYGLRDLATPNNERTN